MATLVLRATEVRGPDRWRWELADPAGRPLARHDVALDSAGTQRAAFTDLAEYLRWNADPGDRPASEAILLDRVGGWAGRHVLGPAVCRALRDAGRVTVRVEVPAAGLFLLNYPLELAHAGGTPLVRRGVTLVWQIAGAPRPTRRPGRDAVRVLGLFSMPTGLAALAVRRERHALTRLVRELAEAGRAVHLEVLQYGVTRQRLREAAADGEGWDVLHACGHGLAGGLVLEAADGTPDQLPTGDLVELLRPARPRLSLAVLSTCDSGAAVTAAAMRSLDLVRQAAAVERQARQEATAAGTVGLAQGLVRELGVAVLGMRYALDDEFAVRLARELYTRLLRDGEPVDMAVTGAIPAAADDGVVPALSVVTPMLVGPAAGLTLAPPRGPAGPEPRRLPALPPELRDLPRFVGRTDAILAATAALAAGSGRPGVVLRGMAGVGKTWCAAELAHHNEHRFEAVAWWSAADRNGPATAALLDLATALDRQLGGPPDRLAGAVAAWQDPDQVPAPLVALLRDRRLLLVLDRLDTLTAPDGRWRDPRWAGLLTAASAPGGRSQLVVTTRAALPGTDRLLEQVLHPLTLRESVLLARELPQLRALLHLGEAADAARVRTDRDLVRRVLAVVRGHPALLVRADTAAAVPADLAARLESAERHALAGAPTLPVLLDATPDLAPGQALAMLADWTRDALAGLDGPAALLARLLAALEDDDRTADFVAELWPGMARLLLGDDSRPDLQATLAALIAAALIEVVPEHPEGDRYRLHPATAETIRDSTPWRVRDLVAEAAARIWFNICKQLRAEEDRTGLGGAGSAAVRTAFAAAPYFARRRNWNGLGFLMAVAFQRDPSQHTARRVIAYLDLLPENDDPDLLDARGTRAQAFGVFDRPCAVRKLRAVREQAIRHGRTRTVETAESELTALGAPVEPADTGTAAHPDDPFPRLITDINQAIQRHDAGAHREAFNATTALLSRLGAITPDTAWRFNQALWPLREMVLRVRRDTAQALEDWETAIRAHDDLGATMVQRNAGEDDVAAVAWGGVMPLILTDRFERAEEILRFCQRVLARQSDATGLRDVFTLRAVIANQRGHPDEAVTLQQNALRYAYRAGSERGIGQAHAVLGGDLARLPGRLADGLAHRLAAALVPTGGAGPDRLLREIGLLLRDPARPAPPATADELAGIVDAVPGSHFAETFRRRLPAPADRQAALDSLLAAARNLNDADLIEPDLLARMAPGIEAVVAAARGDLTARKRVHQDLSRLELGRHWPATIAALGRIADGQVDPAAPGDLLDALDPPGAAVVGTVLARLRAAPPAPSLPPRP